MREPGIFTGLEVISLKPGGAIELVAKPLEDIVKGTHESNTSIRARKMIKPSPANRNIFSRTGFVRKILKS